MRNIVKEGKNGFSFLPNNPSSLASCLEHFFSNKESLWDIDGIRQSAVKNFSWGKTAEETYSLFRKLRREKTALTTISPPDESLQPV
jgi:glycosyltransferase involved in cell wall biosynthesis